MNIIELNFENIGDWPRFYKAIPIVLISAMLTVIFYYSILNVQLEYLRKVKGQEYKLKNELVEKIKVASNLTLYKEHIIEVENVLNGFVYKLPNKKELARLLDDISFIGSHNGLQFKSINWGIKIQNDLSDEVPISIKVVGSFEQLGQFSADIAALSRIVVLEDLHIKPAGNNELLMLDVIAKTYHYKE